MGPNEEPASAVCDAGPLIHLDQLGSLDLLEGFPDLIIPEQVWREVERHRPGALERANWDLRLPRSLSPKTPSS